MEVPPPPQQEATSCPQFRFDLAVDLRVWLETESDQHLFDAFPVVREGRRSPLAGATAAMAYEGQTEPHPVAGLVGIQSSMVHADLDAGAVAAEVLEIHRGMSRRPADHLKEVLPRFEP